MHSIFLAGVHRRGRRTIVLARLSLLGAIALLALIALRCQVMLVRARLVSCLHVAEALDELTLKFLVPHHVEYDVATTRTGRRSGRYIKAHIVPVASPRLFPSNSRRRRHAVEQILHADTFIVLKQAGVVIIPCAAHRTALGPFYIPVIHE